VTSLPATRLPAAARRQALVEAGLRVFEGGSYSGSTTADIAREAGVSEPILYRHFASKRELYFACVDEAWARLRRAFEAKIEEFGPERAVFAIGAVVTGLKSKRTLVPNLWIQAITEAGEDPEIRRYLRGHLREVHDFVADLVRCTQAAGGVPTDRDPTGSAGCSGTTTSRRSRQPGSAGSPATFEWDQRSVPGCGSGDNSW